MTQDPQALPPAAVLTADHSRILRMSLNIANRAVLEGIRRAAGMPVAADAPGFWYDTRPMLDPRESSPETIDLLTEYLDYAIECGLARRHTQLPHLVRLNQP